MLRLLEVIIILNLLIKYFIFSCLKMRFLQKTSFSYTATKHRHQFISFHNKKAKKKKIDYENFWLNQKNTLDAIHV
jgi:hypothetical protein